MFFNEVQRLLSSFSIKASRLIIKTLGGNGQVVSELAFYSDGPSSIPAATYILYVNLFLKKRK